MTRINCIDPALLLDEHLRAEYREISRLWNYRVAGRDLPATYRLGTGHVLFFLDKGRWVTDRVVALATEMRARGFKADWSLEPWPGPMGAWAPGPDDVALLRSRLLDRIPKNPHLCRQRLTPEAAARHYRVVLRAASAPPSPHSTHINTAEPDTLDGLSTDRRSGDE